MRKIRASDIGSYLFCQRAWWYRQQGIASENLADLAGGRELHHQHGRKVLTSGILRMAAYALLLAALIITTVYTTMQNL
jgi:CRISPR/Cas system-associated exonuclease Cas4 (RecB family)